MKRSVGQREGQDGGSSLLRGREHYAQRAWTDACETLQAADAESPLAIDDLECLVWSAGLSGNTDVMLKAIERAHHARLQAGEDLRAARLAFWAGFRLMPLGEIGRAQAWFARAQRIVDRIEGECAERGYLLLPEANRQLFAGNFAEAGACATLAAEIGERCTDPDLIALARVLVGRVLLKSGDVARGLGCLDDAMLTAASFELSPSVTGIIYCHVIGACSQVYALDRAREWTAALSKWCDSQPQRGAFAGSCHVHRAELMQLGGAWSESLAEARRAEQLFSGKLDPLATGDAFYQRAEIHRLRGELALAEAAYAQASGAGREPLPGLALLRLAQDRCETAVSAMRRILATTHDRLQRVRYLPAHVEIMLAAGELDEARTASDELRAIAGAFDTDVLGTIAAQADAAVLLAEGNAQAAVAPLRAALLVWQRLGAPYLAARLHVSLGRAFRELGDEDGAQLEWSAARETFDTLGAALDARALAALVAIAAEPGVPAPATAPRGLSARELQVLRLIAAGKTNRAIAAELHVSEKTVDRHVSNIFGKIDVQSRAAATAFAYEQGLVGARTG